MKRASASATMTPFRFSFLRSTWDLGSERRKTRVDVIPPARRDPTLPLRVWENLHGVQDGATQLRLGVSHAGQREARNPAQAVALVLPGHRGLAQVDLLVHQ